MYTLAIRCNGLLQHKRRHKEIRQEIHIKLDDDEKRAYMKAVKYVVKKMTSTDDSNSTECMWPISVEVIVVDSTDILDPYVKVKR